MTKTLGRPAKPKVQGLQMRPIARVKRCSKKEHEHNRASVYTFGTVDFFRKHGKDKASKLCEKMDPSFYEKVKDGLILLIISKGFDTTEGDACFLQAPNTESKISIIDSENRQRYGYKNFLVVIHSGNFWFVIISAKKNNSVVYYVNDNMELIRFGSSDEVEESELETGKAMPLRLYCRETKTINFENLTKFSNSGA